jgi:ribose 5-phosphate isomerase A
VASAQRLRALGVAVLRLEEVDELPIYVDGADEATPDRRLIKGGGGALTREKIVAAASLRFVCIVDRSKLVERLGRFPLPVEVIPMARRQVATALERLGGKAKLRPGFTTDNGNVILDVHDMPLDDPVEVEGRIDLIPGVVSNGLFCRRPADVLLIGGPSGVRTIGGE